MNTHPRTLILGATGSIGCAITQNLLARQWPVTILVRNRAKAEKMFSHTPSLTILEGDVQDRDALIRAAVSNDFIVHAINYPYNEWVGNMASATQNVIEAATQAKATIVFPGNVYSFGKTRQPIREDSLPNPDTRKGQLRAELEVSLETAARAGRCRVINVRLPDFWGPNVVHEGIAPVFEGALRGKAMPWLMNADIAHQSVYTPDAAEIIARLMVRSATQSETVPPYEVWNYGGVTLSSIRSWFGQIAALTGKPPKVQVIGRLPIRLLGLFKPVLGEVVEMLYLYENTIVLDDAAVRAVFPDFRETPMTDALTTTLDWFARQRLRIPFNAHGVMPPTAGSTAPGMPVGVPNRAETPPASRPSIS
ncbi:MAG: NAD(P)H-binding protein [Bacteroidetes bacterium]|nr:NAD(P)H-binding protein [Fibrella sp.]